jgi:hypothetical protein
MFYPIPLHCVSSTSLGKGRKIKENILCNVLPLPGEVPAGGRGKTKVHILLYIY